MRPIDMLSLQLDFNGSPDEVIQRAIDRLSEDTKALAHISEEAAASSSYAEECRRDAERYRWLRAFTGHRLQVMDRGQEMAYYDTALDAAIDREREGDCDQPIRTAADYDRAIDATFAGVKPLPGNPESEIGTGNPKPVGRCATTQTERYRVEGCTCPTYPGNEGLPCLTWSQSRAADRCAYCDHNLECHRRLSAMFKGSHAVGHLNATDTAAILKGARAALIRYGAPAGEPYLEVLDLAVQRCHLQDTGYACKECGDTGLLSLADNKPCPACPGAKRG